MIMIYVDDIRTPNSNRYVVCRNYDEAIQAIQYCVDEKIEFILDLDHDLGEEKSGYDICKHIVENQIPVVYVHLHTMNPVGRQNMRDLLTHYGYSVVAY